MTFHLVPLAMFAVLASLSFAAASSVGDRLEVRIFLQDSLPLDSTSAEQAGWTLVDGNASCDEFYGRRYQLDGRLTPTLLFDNTGVVAGLQVLTNTSTFPMYPDTNLQAPLVRLIDDDLAAMTFYFMDPAKLCVAVDADHTEGSLGDRFWVRKDLTCNAASCFDVIPLEEYDGMLDGLSYQYAQAGCAPAGFFGDGSPGMGRHYWGNTTGDCEDMAPLFLLYDRSKLVAFGLAYVSSDMRLPTMGGELPEPRTATMGEPSRWELPRQPLVPYFFNQEDMPSFFENLNTFNDSLPHGSITAGTMHVFLSDPWAMTCESVSENSTGPASTTNSTGPASTTDSTDVSGSTTTTVRDVLFFVLSCSVLHPFV